MAAHVDAERGGLSIGESANSGSSRARKSRRRKGIVPLRGLPLLALLAIAVALPATASARPTVKVTAKIVPIPVDLTKPSGPKYPGTGSILGAGAALEAKISVSGTEYFGFPSPLTRVVVELPAGTKLHPQGFVTCSNAILESHEVAKCPKKSIAGAKGEVLGIVSFGESRVQEKATLQAFFAAGNKLAFYTEGVTPVSLEILTTAGFTTAPKPFGPKFTAEVPLVSTVPGAPYASVLSIKGLIGAAFKQGKKLISYGTVPKKCPKGGFTGKVELTFLSGETVSALPTVPCPKR